MSYLYDRFATVADARAFIAESGRLADVCATQAESDAIDPFPFTLTPPIVVLARYDTDTDTDENALMYAAARHGGVFRGT